jgi:hypothetical protein
MLARVLSAAVNGIEAFPVEVEVNCGWGDTVILMIGSFFPISNRAFRLADDPPRLPPLKRDTGTGDNKRQLRRWPWR